VVSRATATSASKTATQADKVIRVSLVDYFASRYQGTNAMAAYRGGQGYLVCRRRIAIVLRTLVRHSTGSIV
jgi:hypothetical protein